jgi:hypothetical protein
MRTLWLVPLVMLGCNAAPEDRIADFQPPAAPDNAFMLTTPPVRNIAPGSSNEYCTWTDYVAQSDLNVRAISAYQTHTGHHVVLYVTPKLREPGTTRLCTEDDMATFRYIAVAGGEGNDWKNEAPGELTYVVPKGMQMVLNHHYLNASPKMLDAQSALTIYKADPTRKYTPVGGLAFVDTSMSIPAGNPSLDIDCTLDRPFKAFLMYPHMHRWGSKISVEHTRGDKVEKLFDVEWRGGFDFDPPMMRKTPEAPQLFMPGDKVKVHCEWNITEPMTFGMEMCVTFAATVDDAGYGNIKCDKGVWGTF